MVKSSDRLWTVPRTEVGDYRLYDVRTGRLISEVIGDEDTQSLKPDAPEWAQLLQERLHKQWRPYHPLLLLAPIQTVSPAGE